MLRRAQEEDAQRLEEETEDRENVSEDEEDGEEVVEDPATESRMVVHRVSKGGDGPSRVTEHHEDFFTRIDVDKDRANVVVENIAKKLVHDTRYEERVRLVVKYRADYLNEKIPKKRPEGSILHWT
ncbi:hypothetical protein D1007_36236 [Hordeum vulgare]|nr:hypothetical protein D1007_36236 [Hordeum vulgare]